MTTTPARTRRAAAGRTPAALIAVVVAVLAIAVGAAVPVDAQASTGRDEIAGTRVRVHNPVHHPVVGAEQNVLPGQGRETPVAAAVAAIGSRVAPHTAGLADDAVTTGARATGHGAERLAQAGFTDDLIAQTRAGFITRQTDGATVFAREVSPGRFDFIIEG